jgi:hypothetical protein
MKSNDTLKIIIAVVILAAAGIFIVIQFGGGGGSAAPRGSEPVELDWDAPEPVEGEPGTPFFVPPS